MKDQEIIEDSWVIDFTDIEMTECEDVLKMEPERLPRIFCSCGSEATFIVCGFSSYSGFCEKCRGKNEAS